MYSCIPLHWANNFCPCPWTGTLGNGSTVGKIVKCNDNQHVVFVFLTELYKVIFIQDDVEEDVQVTEIKKRRT